MGVEQVSKVPWHRLHLGSEGRGRRKAIPVADLHDREMGGNRLEEKQRVDGSWKVLEIAGGWGGFVREVRATDIPTRGANRGIHEVTQGGSEEYKG